MVLGLRRNFHKSRILGFNVDSVFLESTSDFLACSISHHPLDFLGIPLGVNPRRRSLWVPILEKNEMSSFKLEKQVHILWRSSRSFKCIP